MTNQTQPTLALNDGAAMPQFGLGVFQTPPDETERVVKMAVDEGYRLVDTASMYRNEDGVGKALLGRTDVFVTTKLGNSDHGFDEALRAFDESARKLRRGALDLYLIHWPRPRVDRYVESWKAFVRLQQDGRVRSIGVSNFNRDHLERIIGETGVTPAVNQVELHPRFQQRALRAFHDQRGIKTESWSPLGRGGLLSEPAIVDIAAKHRKTQAQVAIRWHL
ncbi:MAG: aldo/keto reductase, partial [Roseiarcus sp.]